MNTIAPRGTHAMMSLKTSGWWATALLSCGWTALASAQAPGHLPPSSTAAGENRPVTEETLVAMLENLALGDVVRTTDRDRFGKEVSVYRFCIQRDGWDYVYEVLLDGDDVRIVCPVGKPLPNRERVGSDDVYRLVKRYEKACPVGVEVRRDNRLVAESRLDRFGLTPEILNDRLTRLMEVIRDTHRLTEER
jgi:hypothetical protein